LNYILFQDAYLFENILQKSLKTKSIQK